MVSLDKALEVNQVSARVGDNIEIKCDVTGSPNPPIVWRRHGLDLTQLAEEELKVFPDGALYINSVRLIHAGNYTCHAQRNKDVVQTHILHVHSTLIILLLYSRVALTAKKVALLALFPLAMVLAMMASQWPRARTKLLNAEKIPRLPFESGSGPFLALLNHIRNRSIRLGAM